MGRHTSASQANKDDDQSALQPGVLRRHRKATIAVLSILLVPMLALGGYALYINSSLNNIGRVAVNLSEDGRPTDDGGQNILLVGVDYGNKSSEEIAKLQSTTSIAEDSKRQAWPVGRYHSDVIMIAHVSKNKEKVSLVSIPRDSYVEIYDDENRSQGKNRVNEALSRYGPAAAIHTAERLTDLRIDNLAMVDFNGFKDITDAVGGVDVHIPERVYYRDGTRPSGEIAWEQGNIQLDGETALRYVRDRQNLPNSDYSRIRRQQNFLRAVLAKLKSKGTLTSPKRLKSTLDAVTTNLSVDENWRASQIRGLVFSLRNTSGSDIQFVTLPIDGYSEMIDGIGSVVNPDTALVSELSSAVRRNQVGQFAKKYPKQSLDEQQEVQ